MRRDGKEKFLKSTMNLVLFQNFIKFFKVFTIKKTFKAFTDEFCFMRAMPIQIMNMILLYQNNFIIKQRKNIIEQDETKQSERKTTPN